METMRKATMWQAALASGGLAVCAGPALAQSPTVAGTLNLRTGQFQIRPSTLPQVATTLYTGTFDVTINITIASAIPSAQAIMCNASITATDSTYAQHDEDASVLAVRTGNTAVCTLVVPYAWALGSTPTYTFGWQLSSTASAGVPQRLSGFYPATGVAVPAKGATTKLTAAVTL